MNLIEFSDLSNPFYILKIINPTMSYAILKFEIYI